MRPGRFLLPIALALVPQTFAGTAILHFDEFGTNPQIDVNSVSGLGVSFLFTPGTAVYNGGIGAGTTVNLSDPVLVGPTSGTLMLAFDSPIDFLSFDIALESVDAISNAYNVTMGGNSFSGDTAPQIVFSEGHFAYSGIGTFTSATITFSNAAPEFAIDNLSFGAPEPSTGLPVGAAAMVLALLGLIRNRLKYRNVGH